MMTKGAAAGLAFVVIGVFSFSMREFGFLKQRSFWGGIAVALLIAAPWHIHQLATHGDRFLNDYGARHFTQFFDRIPGEETPGPRWDLLLPVAVEIGAVGLDHSCIGSSRRRFHC